MKIKRSNWDKIKLVDWKEEKKKNVIIRKLSDKKLVYVYVCEYVTNDDEKFEQKVIVILPINEWLKID